MASINQASWILFVLGISFSAASLTSAKEGHRNLTSSSSTESENSYSRLDHHPRHLRRQILPLPSSQLPSPHPSYSFHSLDPSPGLHGRMAPSTLQGAMGSPTLEIPMSGASRSLTQGEDAEERPKGPYFVVPQTTHISTRAGQQAVLTCVVKQLGDRQVSWIRGRDLHVLSSGPVAFSSDSRVSVSHAGDSWTLVIQYTQPRDAGQYSCQVNTQPKMATWYNLTVIEARAKIHGKETLYVQAGSTVTLECVIKEELVIPGLVLWYQDDHLVDKESSRVHVVNAVTNITVSTLTVLVAEDRDSGNYSCWPAAGRPDSVMVHVIQGEPPAAMHHGNTASGLSSFSSILFLILLIPVNFISLLFLLT